MVALPRKKLLHRALLYLTVGLLFSYVGSYYYFRSAGLVSARKLNIRSQYLLADPDDSDFVSAHYARAQFYFPLVYLNDRHFSDERLFYP